MGMWRIHKRAEKIWPIENKMRAGDPHGGKHAGVSQTSGRRGNFVSRGRRELAEKTLSEGQAVAVSRLLQSQGTSRQSRGTARG
jgi:hypothetical protein